MLIETLPKLRCPTFLAENETCAGELSLIETKKKKGNDVLFGTLACKECESTYPILAGIAVLVNDVETYIQAHVKGISALVKSSDVPQIYRESFLLAKAALDNGYTEEDIESLRVNALYYMSHYLNVKKAKKNPWWRPKNDAFSAEIDQLMQSLWDKGPFSKVAEWSKPLKNQIVIELGCGVGGIARVITNQLQSYIGVDCAFTSIALARHIHLGSPYSAPILIPQDLYNGALTLNVEPSKPSRNSRNIDFIVGELENIPVVKEHFDIAIALNTIDMIEDPRHLPRLQFELLKKNGIAIQSSPYIWHELVAENLRKSLPKSIKSSSEAAEYLYKKAGFKIYKKINHLPWLFLKQFREIAVYSVHIFAARKMK